MFSNKISKNTEMFDMTGTVPPWRPCFVVWGDGG